MFLILFLAIYSSIFFIIIDGYDNKAIDTFNQSRRDFVLASIWFQCGI